MYIVHVREPGEPEAKVALGAGKLRLMKAKLGPIPSRDVKVGRNGAVLGAF